MSLASLGYYVAPYFALGMTRGFRFHLHLLRLGFPPDRHPEIQL